MTNCSVQLTRRALLLCGAAGVALTGCSATGSSSPAPSAPTAAPEPSVPALPDVDPYVVLPGEVEPAAKEAAVRFVEDALTQRPPPRAEDARSSSPGPSQPAGAAAAALASVLPLGSASAVRILYPQYGGLTPQRDLASVMVIAEQLIIDAPGTGVLSRPLTVDVRLTAASGAWVVTEALLGAPAPAAPSISPVAQAVLGERRIVLPGVARADVLSGTVDDRVLDALIQLSQRWTIDVHVFTSGHPPNVFATDRVSNHTRGLAVDVWALDGIPVIERARSPWREVLLAAADVGASELGGPEDLGERPFFSDQVHQDHLHLGFGVAGAPRDPEGGAADQSG